MRSPPCCPMKLATNFAFHIDARVALFAAVSHDRDRPPVWTLPGDSQHTSRSAVHVEGADRPTVGRPRRRALPHDARDGADRLVDGAAGSGRTVHPKPEQRQPGRSRREGGQHGDLRRVAGAERLHARSARWSSSSGSRRNCRRFPASPASPRRWCPSFRTATGATGSPWKASSLGPTSTTARDTTRLVRGTSERWAFRSSAGREFTAADALGKTKGRHRQRGVREEVQSRSQRRRQAHGRWRRRNEGKLDTEIVGFVRDAKYSEVKGTIPPLYFTPYRQNDGLGSITFYVRTSLEPSALLGMLPRVVARLDPNLPLEDVRTMPQQVTENVFLDLFHQRAVGGVRRARDAARGDRPVRRARVHRRPADAGDRSAHGARRRAGPRPPHGAATGGPDDAGWRRHRAGSAVWLGRAAESMLFELKGYDPRRPGPLGRRPCRSWRSQQDRSPRIAPRTSSRCRRSGTSRSTGRQVDRSQGR